MCGWSKLSVTCLVAALTSSDSLRVLTRKVVRCFQVQPVVQLSHFNGLYTEERRGEEGRGREGTERGGKERRWRTGKQHEEERQTHRVLQWARTHLTPLAHGLVELDQEIKVLAFPKECLSLFLQVRTNGMYHNHTYFPPTPHPHPYTPVTPHTHTHTHSPPTPTPHLQSWLVMPTEPTQVCQWHCLYTLRGGLGELLELETGMPHSQ